MLVGASRVPIQRYLRGVPEPPVAGIADVRWVTGRLRGDESGAEGLDTEAKQDEEYAASAKPGVKFSDTLSNEVLDGL